MRAVRKGAGASEAEHGAQRASALAPTPKGLEPESEQAGAKAKAP